MLSHMMIFLFIFQGLLTTRDIYFAALLRDAAGHDNTSAKVYFLLLRYRREPPTYARRRCRRARLATIAAICVDYCDAPILYIWCSTIFSGHLTPLSRADNTRWGCFQQQDDVPRHTVRYRRVRFILAHCRRPPIMYTFNVYASLSLLIDDSKYYTRLFWRAWLRATDNMLPFRFRISESYIRASVQRALRASRAARYFSIRAAHYSRALPRILIT